MRHRLRVPLFVAAVTAAACVEIATGPDGVASIRLQSVPPSIVVGDTLRDSTGAVVSLRAFAYDEKGQPIGDAPFRFTGLALPRDTTAAARVVPVVVDSVMGTVRALATTIATRARLAVRLGDRLQIVDTINVVKPPTRIDRANTADTLLTMAFFCSEDSARATSPTQLTVGTNDVANVGNAQPLSVAVTADSATATATLRAPVPGYYVRYEILPTPTLPTIPTTQWRGTTRPAISIISDFSTDRATNTDTTEATGIATAYLRVLPTGLGPGVVATDTFSVRVRATARRTTTRLVPPDSGVVFRVRLRRLTSLLGSGTLTGPGCSR